MALYGNPERFLTTVGITGTNGKTTTAWLLRSILEAAGKTTGLLGTIEYSDGRKRMPASLTTPAPQQLAQMFAEMTSQKASHCVMEISSHALDQSRCAAVPLTAAAITNITRDHFDYHNNAENYRTAKSRIADLLIPNAPLLIGIDDPGCRTVLGQLSSRASILSFGFCDEARIRAEIIAATSSRQQIRLTLLHGTVDVQLSLVGRHNVLNALTAAGLAEQLGVNLSVIAESLEAATHVPGRMERVDSGQPFSVFVDYAHTPDGIANCLATARSLSHGRVILVFGAGGDRDRDKRPEMAQAAEGADVVIVTSDNPRSESPAQIISDICSGFSSMVTVHTEADRNRAIQRAIQTAEPDDVVVIAGRGHETVQQMGDKSISFDDRKVVQHAVRELLSLKLTNQTWCSGAIPA